MNLAHVHLMLNHIPILGVPFTLLVLLAAIVRKDEYLKRLALILAVMVALFSLPAYFTGEPAEDVVKKLPTFSKELVHEHEEAAEFAFVMTLISGAIAAATLFLKNDKVKKYGVVVLTIVLVVASVSLMKTANEGGKISHPEFKTTQQ